MKEVKQSQCCLVRAQEFLVMSNVSVGLDLDLTRPCFGPIHRARSGFAIFSNGLAGLELGLIKSWAVNDTISGSRKHGETIFFALD